MSVVRVGGGIALERSVGVRRFSSESHGCAAPSVAPEVVIPYPGWCKLLAARHVGCGAVVLGIERLASGAGGGAEARREDYRRIFRMRLKLRRFGTRRERCSAEFKA
jgi:hypothetical protein